MRRTALLTPLLLLAGASACAPPPPTQAGTCHDEALAGFAGNEATPAALADLQRASGAKAMRVVQPGMMVTMDFSPERVTVQLAPGNRIQRASCG